MSRFNVNVDELRQFNPRLASYVVHHPLESIKMFEDHLNSVANGLGEEGGSGKGSRQKNAAHVVADANFPKKVLIYHVNFEGNFG